MNPNLQENLIFVLFIQAIGLLIGMEELPVEKQATFVSALLVPLCGQVTV
jgi:hypothetical protein